MSVDISIIIPIYNVKKYLSECIKSVCEQRYENIEIILVDDGSTDGSDIICDTYANQDTRITVIHQNNMGRVEARRVGIQNAIGKYVVFVDGDDWINRDLCVTLLELQEKYNADLITYGFIEEHLDKKIVKLDGLKEGIYKSKIELQFLLDNSMICGKKDELGILANVWTKLYRRDIAVEVMTNIPKKLYRGEDILFNNLYLKRCKSVYIYKNALYHYRMHEASTVNSACPDLLEQIGITHHILTKALCNENRQLQGLHMRIWLNVIRLWNKEFDEKLPMHIPYYCFDFGKLKGKKIILYGAGKVGKDYYWQFKKMFPERLVLWIDKDSLEIKSEKYEVHHIVEIEKADYDEILIAVDSEETAINIKKELIEIYEISQEKIQWFKPEHYWL